jgi:hypothetical protein
MSGAMTTGTPSLLNRLKESYKAKQPLESRAPLVARLVYRRLSFYLSVPFAFFNVSPTYVTVMRIPLSMIGAAGIGTGGRRAVIMGCSLYVATTLLDYVDGNLARLYGSVSRFGDNLDHLAHVVENTLLPLALGVGVFNHPDLLLRHAHLFGPEIGLGIGVAGSLLWCLTTIARLECRLLVATVTLRTFTPAASTRSDIRPGLSKLAPEIRAGICERMQEQRCVGQRSIPQPCARLAMTPHNRSWKSSSHPGPSISTWKCPPRSSTS